MKKILFIAFSITTALLRNSCTSSEKKPVSNFLKFETKIIENKIGECDGKRACAQVSFEYPVFEDKNTKVNVSVNNYITKKLCNSYNTETVEGSVEKFMSEFKEFIKEFPDATSNEWVMKSKYIILENSQKHLSLSLEQEGYTGGAHGYRNILYSNFDPKTGDYLFLDNIISDKIELNKIAKEIFFEKYKLNKDESLSSQGYSFENDIFAINNNFSITTEGISFHYGQYEIASYAQGMFDVFIPKEKIKSILK